MSRGDRRSSWVNKDRRDAAFEKSVKEQVMGIKKTEEPPQLTQADAMLIVIHATNVYATLMTDEDHIPSEVQQGMTLMYEGLLTKTKDLLPNLPALEHIFKTIEEVERVTRKIRDRLDLPAKL